MGERNQAMIDEAKAALRESLKRSRALGPFKPGHPEYDADTLPAFEEMKPGTSYAIIVPRKPPDGSSI